jgi:hypothetical protein
MESMASSTNFEAFAPGEQVRFIAVPIDRTPLTANAQFFDFPFVTVTMLKGGPGVALGIFDSGLPSVPECIFFGSTCTRMRASGVVVSAP